MSSSSRLSAGASSSGHSPTSPSGRIGATLGARPKHRSRTGSMPAVPRHKPIAHTKRGSVVDREEVDNDEGVEYYRLRSFSITANGVFNVGDLFKARRSSANSSNCSSTRDMRRLSLASQGLVYDADEAEQVVTTHKVGMLGAQGVGKTSLVRQFATSECRCAYDYSPDEECAQKTICVMLDGQETQLEIIDHRAGDMSVETFCSTYNPDIYVVVYSVVNKRSFKEAEEMLVYLTNRNYMTTHGVILVGNKVDLERQRQVPSEVGRRLANSCECKFIETSLNLDHHVDELLVGILAQIKLNSKRNRDQDGKRYKHGSQILKRLLSFKGKTKSCENLFIL
ncbi:ras-related protein Rap-2b-like [Pseudomyrmex gracilis]|uniref:ras-related protein Rap-2b-like n=1 Tax=Pseudomyrmex gracilis TaxID=219809 RepID=UPI000995DBFF|nr:ras-related protein Rap-2b-like [Pseudomyrmex gracilis]